MKARKKSTSHEDKKDVQDGKIPYDHIYMNASHNSLFLKFDSSTSRHPFMENKNISLNPVFDGFSFGIKFIVHITSR